MERFCLGLKTLLIREVAWKTTRPSLRFHLKVLNNVDVIFMINKVKYIRKLCFVFFFNIVGIMKHCLTCCVISGIYNLAY